MSSDPAAKIPRHILPLIIFAQFAGVSTWFVGNAVLSDLTAVLSLPEGALGRITGAVQLGFIAGTLTFALLLVADRFPAGRVFLTCSLLGAICNAGMLLPGITYDMLLLLRLLTGFCLAGIYPVGMKIAADWYQQGLGKALGYLVGALVLGTGFPHAASYFLADLPWQAVVGLSSGLSVAGGLMLAFGVPDGPYRKQGTALDIRTLGRAFQEPSVRGAALGYFGHMWELYAFWAFVPVLLQAYFGDTLSAAGVSLLSFGVIVAGVPGCVVGGYLSLRKGSKWVAVRMLGLSGLCALVSPFLVQAPLPVFVVFLLVWGFAVVGDSPQFSTLMARHALPAYKGSVLTISTTIGFALTVGSIALLGYRAADGMNPFLFYWLLPGPVIGLLGLRRVVS
ncbi:MAG: MFS transporter [Saprospiraceae bacterium]|nr:MFS transporter [Saprospiraceae bacterium]